MLLVYEPLFGDAAFSHYSQSLEDLRGAENINIFKCKLKINLSGFYVFIHFLLITF